MKYGTQYNVLHDLYYNKFKWRFWFMKKSSKIIAIVALIVSLVGIAISLVAYFKKKSCVLCDDLEDDFIDYYDDEDECSCNCESGDCNCGENCLCHSEEATEAPANAEQTEVTQETKEEKADKGTKKSAKAEETK